MRQGLRNASPAWLTPKQRRVLKTMLKGELDARRKA